MTAIPVAWLTLNPDAIPRGYWDQGVIEALFDESLWRVPGGFTFEHTVWAAGALDRARWAEQGGAVVVIPARHHLGHVAEIRELLAALPWAVVIFTGDEAAEFPWSKLRHPRLAVWAMGATPEHNKRVDVPLGSGFPPWFRAELPTAPPRKDVDVTFAGQVTHQRRREAVEMLRSYPGPHTLVETEGFTLGVGHAEYAALLAEAKIALCPSGPESPDSFRFYEALEAGCVPLADAATPTRPEPLFWHYIVGEEPPFPEVSAWDHAPAIITQALAAWPANANRVSAWWMRYKRQLAYRLHADVARVSGRELVMAPDEQITVVVTSSPAQLHPSTAHLEQTVDSIRHHLPRSDIVLAFDGVRPEQQHRRGAYEEYVRQACWLAHRRWTNVLPFILPSWRHQALLTRRALELVRTPLVLFAEHDTPLVPEREIDWPALVAAVRSGRAEVVRLYHEAGVHPDHAHLMLDTEPVDVEGAPLLRTVQWSQRPHLARSLWYERLLDDYFAPQARTMIEDVIHGVVQSAWLDHGVPGWEEWRLWLYAPDGSMQRSLHLDSRGDEDKYPMRFAYPGAPPAGAPR